MAPHYSKFTDKKKKDFLEVLSKTANISKAAAAVGSTRRTAYNHKESDPEFSADWDNAMEHAVDELEEAARARALGYEEPVFNKDGEQVSSKVKYSDLLTIFLLKGNRPEKYRERYELSGDPNRPLTVQEVSDEQLEAVVANGVVTKTK